MSGDLPQKKRLWPRVLAGLLIAVVLAALLFPVGILEPENRGRVFARTSVLSLSTAFKAYYIEYGKWPDFTGDGLFSEEQRQARLMRVVLGKDEVNNPSKIVFFEVRTATQRFGHYHSGLHPETGACFDPWGNPYHIVLDTDGDEKIANPYPDDPPIHARVIVWSLGKDGKQGSPANPHTCKGSDDVTSWQ